MKKVCLILFSLLMCVVFIPRTSVKGKTLQNLKDELAKYEAQYEENKNNKNKTQEEINNINSSIKNINNEVLSINNEMVKLTDEIGKLEVSIDEKKDEIDDVLSFLQVSSSESMYLEYVFGAKTFTDFIYRASIAEQLTKYNDSLVSEYNQMIVDNKAKSKQMDQKKVELASKQVELKNTLAELGNNIQEYDALALDIEDDIKARKSEIRIYEDLGCKANEDIATCGRGEISDTGFTRPVKSGIVTSNYGYRDCSEAGVSCFHNGLDISAANANYSNIPVYAAANGVVVYIRPWAGQSRLCGANEVFIQHSVKGVSYITGYLHLRSINVATGQIVTSNTQIGVMGGNAWYDSCSTGSHLHFEVSTGSFSRGNYYSNRFNPRLIINVPAEWVWY